MWAEAHNIRYNHYIIESTSLDGLMRGIHTYRNDIYIHTHTNVDGNTCIHTVYVQI